MDLIEEVKRRSEALRGAMCEPGVKAVIHHIEAAERYLFRGRSDNDDSVFNDVIYRTNQAFEGSLKEAYGVLTEESGDAETPHQIEQHLLDADVLAPRVLDLFTNYRRNWRNPSTHDHKLRFGEQEALLAIVSVAAFISILLDQMVEAIAARTEREELRKRRKDLADTFDDYENLPFPDQLVAILRFFAADAPIEQLRNWSEPEFVGRVKGYLESANEQLETLREPSLSPRSATRPDLAVRKGEEVVVIELKRTASPSIATVESSKNQLLSWLKEGGLDHGIAFFAPETAGDPLGVEEFQIEQDGRTLTIIIIGPTMAR